MKKGGNITYFLAVQNHCVRRFRCNGQWLFRQLLS